MIEIVDWMQHNCLKLKREKMRFCCLVISCHLGLHYGGQNNFEKLQLK